MIFTQGLKSERAKNIFIAATLVFMLLIMGIIFYFSAQPAKSSKRESGHIEKKVIATFFSDFFDMSEQTQQKISLMVSKTVRKTAHFSEFAALGFAIALHFGAINLKKPFKKRYFWGCGLGFLYAVSDECHQFFVEGRAPGVLDVIIDTFGVIFGAFVLWLILKILNKIYSGKKTVKN